MPSFALCGVYIRSVAQPLLMSTHCRATPLTEQRRSRGASRGSRRSHEPVAEGRRQSIMQDAWLGARECSRAPPEDGPTPSLFEDSRLTGDRPGGFTGGWHSSWSAIREHQPREQDLRDLLPFAEHTLRGDYSPRHSHGANGLGHSEAAAMARSREEARAKLREMSEQRKSIEEEMEALTVTRSSRRRHLQQEQRLAYTITLAMLAIHMIVDYIGPQSEWLQMASEQSLPFPSHRRQ